MKYLVYENLYRCKNYDWPMGWRKSFYINISKYLQSQGVEVVYDLKDRDIDLILLTDPRLLSESSSLTDFDIKYYKKFINNNVQVVHRINECDERKTLRT